jgi:hypothetical protein
VFYDSVTVQRHKASDRQRTLAVVIQVHCLETGATGVQLSCSLLKHVELFEQQNAEFDGIVGHHQYN